MCHQARSGNMKGLLMHIRTGLQPDTCQSILLPITWPTAALSTPILENKFNYALFGL